jgi:CubicO group peptidase (beta-lactamase class C family)
VGTAWDYLRSAQMLTGGGELEDTRILGRRTVQLLRSGQVPQLMGTSAAADENPFGRGYTYGLGGRVFVDPSASIHGSEGTYSWDKLATTTFISDPVEEITALFLSQIIPGPSDISNQLSDEGIVRSANRHRGGLEL